MASPSQTPGGTNPEAGWFGNRAVDPRDKTRLVRGVFSSVAGRYDLMNDLMSAGIHRLWKSAFVDLVRPAPGERLLDVAGGTGDIAVRLLDRAAATARDRSARPDEDDPPADDPASPASVVICDLSPEMVAIARDRTIDRGTVSGLSFAVGNAEALPFADKSFDAYTISFGLRNVTRIDNALSEARRVLKPGGRFFCLEFSRVALPSLRRLYDIYSTAVIPRLGAVVAGDRDSYQYLVESIRRFPQQQALADRMAAAGLARARWRNLSGGIAAIHSGWRL